MYLDWKHPASGTPYQGGICTVGNFDGVHLGHQHLLQKVRELARAANAPSVAITFDPHPAAVLRPQNAPCPLTTPEQKKELLLRAGADYVLVLKTDDGLLDLEAEEFFQKILQNGLQAKGILEGPGFRFGKNRRGDDQLLQTLCSASGITFIQAQPFSIHGEILSSSRIRSALGQGDISGANHLLGRNYSIQGRVVEGAKRGRLLGFPTANLSAIPTKVPAHGVYSGWCWRDGKKVLAAVNIGPNPTFAEHQNKVEVHLLDFQGDLYSQNLELFFSHKIREVVRFSSKDELISQLQSDLVMVRRQTL